MASAVGSPAERQALRAYVNAMINDASQKATQNQETITGLAHKILDLGGNVPTLKEPIYTPKPNPSELGRKLDCLRQKIQWQEKKIQQCDEIVSKLEQKRPNFKEIISQLK